MADVLEPIESFNTFNEFFYRKLRPGTRKIASPDHAVAVSPADCRLMAFASINDATRLWIKGREFSLERLLDSKPLASQFEGGSLCVCRYDFFFSFSFPFQLYTPEKTGSTRLPPLPLASGWHRRKGQRNPRDILHGQPDGHPREGRRCLYREQEDSHGSANKRIWAGTYA